MESRNYVKKELKAIKQIFEKGMEWKEEDGDWEEKVPSQSPAAVCKQRKFAIALYQNRKFSDVTFVVEGKKIFAHKSQLITSPGLMGILAQSRAQQEIEVKDTDYLTMCYVLKYIYTGQLHPPPDSFDGYVKLLIADSIFWVVGLKEECEAFFVKSMVHHNAIDCLILSDCYDLPRLKEQAILYIVKSPDLIESKKFKKLHPRVWVEVVNVATSNKSEKE